MQASDVREVFETILSQTTLMEAVRASGLQGRERKLDALCLIRSMVIAASTGYGGRQADVMRHYLESGARPVVRGGFYRWFGPALESVMAKVSAGALAYVARHKRDLPGWLGKEVKDWIIVDSSTVKLDDRLKEEYPGAGEYAALKVHKQYSVGVGATIGYHLSAAREHDAPHLRLDETWRGLGLLVELGYACFSLLRECERYGVKYVIRLKENWRAKVEEVISGTVRGWFPKGSDFDDLLAEQTLVLDGNDIDAQVRLGRDVDIACRLVAVQGPKGYCFYLTNLARRVTTKQIVDLYRVRWEIESDNKLDKSCLNLSEIGAQTGAAVRALVHASLVGSILVSMLAHHHRRRETRPSRQGAPRTVAPIHPQTLARAVGSAAGGLARAMTSKGAVAEKRWTELAIYLEHMGRDPNWRRRPSILDQLRGWRITPGRSKGIKSALSVA